MSVEKMPARIVAAGIHGVEVKTAQAGMFAADMYACGIAEKRRELARLTPGTLAYTTKFAIVREAESIRADILAQVEELGG